MKVVLDASALLAFLQDEPGSGAVEDVLAEACISAVNWSEVIQKSMAAEVDVTGLRADLEALGLEVHDFTPEHAEAVGNLWPQTRRYGLSLGDRACMCLGMALKLPVMTTDKAWKKVNLPVQVHVIR
jgi:PIN domain nuclease of toxin-antitoxin system